MSVNRNISVSLGLAGLAVVGAFAVSGSKLVKNTIEDYRKEHEERIAKSNELLTGTVIKEEYFQPADGQPSKYTLTVNLDDGRTIGLTVRDDYSVTRESLNAIIDADKATRIGFPKGNIIEKPYEYVCNSETYFTDTTLAGSKLANRIKVLN